MRFDVKKNIQTVGFLVLSIVLAGCFMRKEVQLSGKTMGTTYHIKVVTGRFDSVAGLEKKIIRRLDEINMSMSTYEKASEISRFNSIQNTHERFRASEDFFAVVTEAMKLYRLTQGSWDGTIKPLVNLWGFGNSTSHRRIPLKEEIAKLLTNVGFDAVEILDDRVLRKKRRQLTLDLGSIAKGYAVDQIAAVIRDSGINDFLVEIGGEVYASGRKKDKSPWRVGINWPSKEAAATEVYRVITLKNRALATSGDYRNFFEINGKRYSHVLDPKTGYPVDNSVVSASVVADSCTFADGLATALMVMGHKKGLELVNRLDNVAAMIIFEQSDGTLVDYYSKGFRVSK